MIDSCVNGFISVTQTIARTASNNGAACTPLVSVPCNDCLLGSPTPVSGSTCEYGFIAVTQSTIIGGAACTPTPSLACNDCTMGPFTTIGICVDGVIDLYRTVSVSPVFGDVCPATTSSASCSLQTVLPFVVPATNPSRPVIGSNPVTFGSNPAPSPAASPLPVPFSVSSSLRSHCTLSLVFIFHLIYFIY